MSNFEFLKNYDMKLYKSANKIETSVNTSPAAVKTYATPFLERVLELLMAEMGLKFQPRKEFYYQLDAVCMGGIISHGFKDRIYDAYDLRNRIHDDIDEMERNEFYIAQQLHEKLFYIAKKLYTDFFPDHDKYEGVPSFKPVEIDTSDDEVDLLSIPDFSQVIDIDYDYCIICGKPNHSSYSLCCHECNRVMDNANNFISIRNYFGKDADLTKDKLVSYGIPEGYVNQFLNSMVKENMLRTKGIYYTFNNMNLDSYLSKIDNYIAVCELITKFREGKLSASQIKQTREFKQGSKKQEPFYQFYKIVKREVVKNFEKYLLSTKDVWKSIEHSTITDAQLKRWYDIQLGNYRKHEFNKAFFVFNDLLIKDYLNLKSQGIVESDIKKTLNISDTIYSFWLRYNPNFNQKLKQIKIDLITQAIKEGKTRDEIIEFAGVTSKEYSDIISVSNKHKDELSKLYNSEITSRQNEFVKYLLNFDLRIACMKSKFSVSDFYDYYDSADVSSRFYIKSTEILMDKYLLLRSRGKTIDEAIESVGIKEIYLNRWLSRSVYADFKDRDVQVKVDLIIKGFKQKKTLEEISHVSGVDAKTIKSWIYLGERGSERYRPLSDYYENVIIPQKLEKFLDANSTKSIRKALDSAKLSEEELEKYYQKGKSGDEKFSEFYNEFLDIKKGTYVYLRNSKRKSHKIAMKESQLSEEEFKESEDKLNGMLRMIKFNTVLETIANDQTSNVAASKAGCSVDDIYDWYFKGREGDEDYKGFYENFHKGYIRPNIVPIQEKLDSENISIDNLIRSNKHLFTKKDFDIWLKNGLITVGVFHIDDENDEEEEEDESKDKVKKINFNKKLFNVNNRKSTLGRVENKNYDIEKLKKEILKK